MSQEFAGYPAPSANTCYTPNQFFDVVLPNSSRGVVRLVGYMLRKVLGWSDAHGNPQEPQVVVSYRELEERAGISHSMIREALDEALSCHYIRCLRDGTAHSLGSQAQVGLYELCWDETDRYVTDPEEFRGFYAGNGNLTYVPNLFLDHTIPNEPLAVVRVVGTIIRHTIGFQSRYGFRRQEVSMSFSELQRRTGIVSPSALTRALEGAIERNHLIRVRDGVFDPQGGRASQAAAYAVRWADRNEVIEPIDAIAPKSVAATPGHHSEKCSGDITPKSVAEGSEKCSGITPKSVAGHHSEKCSDIKITLENNTSKQQQPSRPPMLNPAAAFRNSDSEGFQLLVAAGFDEKDARVLSRQYPPDQIRRQCEYLPLRNPTIKPLGLLRRSIEADWPDPREGSSGEVSEALMAARNFVAHYYAGWAGNAGEPATTPSATEVTAAAPYLERLRTLGSGCAAVQVLGRQFAAYARRESEGNPRATNSFSFTLKLYGEEFFLKLGREAEQAIREQLKVARQSHEKAHRAAYLAWVGERVGELEKKHPEAIMAFTTWDAEKLEGYRRNFPSGSSIFEAMLTDFKRPESRSERLREYLQKHHRDLAPVEFWAWDKSHNPTPFQTDSR